MPPRRPRCAVCGSRQWRKEPSSGLVTCSEGHVLQNYRNETSEVTELGPHSMRKRTLKSSRKKAERKSKADPKLYHGERARYHYFQCLQLLLRMQARALINTWKLPSEFEIICRDIWALHLSLLPNPPPAEPYLYTQEQLRGNEQLPSLPRTQETSPTLVDEEEGRNDEVSEPEEGNEGIHLQKALPSSSSSSEDEEDPEMAKLLRENSETPSSSENEGSPPHPQPGEAATSTKRNARGRKYDTPTSNIAVLVVACWTMRMPVMYMDLVRLIESYDIPYLDPIRLLPTEMTRHLTKHSVQSLSPHFAPTPMYLHRVSSRLAKLIYREYGIMTPELNAAPILWRAVRGLQGTPTLYTLAKKLAGSLSLTLTLHHSLSPKLKRFKKKDPEYHKFDSAPPEVTLVAAVIIVLKLVHGLDGKKRVPQSRDDPACALPNIIQYLAAINEVEQEEESSKEKLFSATSNFSMLDLKDDMLDDYMSFCEKALLPLDKHEPTVLSEYFPLKELSPHPETVDENLSQSNPSEPLHQAMSAIHLHEESTELRPGQAYQIYDARDILGALPEAYERIVNRAAKWAGVEENYVCGIVESCERRLARWWRGVRRNKEENELDSDSDEMELS